MWESDAALLFAFDSLRRLTSAADPEKRYRYFGLRQQRQPADAHGVVTTIAYDALNRPTCEKPIPTYTIDPSGTPTE